MTPTKGQNPTLAGQATHSEKAFLFISLCGFLFPFSFAAGLSRCFSLFLGSYSLLFLNCFSLFSLLCCDLKINFHLSSAPLLSSPPIHWVRVVFWSLCLSPSSPPPLIRTSLLKCLPHTAPTHSRLLDVPKVVYYFLSRTRLDFSSHCVLFTSRTLI